MKKEYSNLVHLQAERRVVVTGAGIVSSIGENIESFNQSLKQGKSGIDLLNNFPAISNRIQIGAQIKDYSFESLLKQFDSLPEDFARKVRECGRRAPYSVQCSIISAIEAWKMAGVNNSSLAKTRIGVVVAGSNISQNLQYTQFEKFQHSPEYITPSYALHFMDTDHVGTISEIFNIQGEGFSVGGASASGNVAIIKGFQLVRQGILDACFVVGALADLSPMELMGFHNIGALGGKKYSNSPEKACRPFDRDHEGFIFGQASACIILESLHSAQERDVRILAEMLGGAILMDGNRLSDPRENGEAAVMEYALRQAGISSGDVDYINAHGTSTPLGDEVELQAIKRVFHRTLRDTFINSTKGLTGHCLYSAGVVEAVAVIMQMNEGYLHPNANLENPIDEDLNFVRETAISRDFKIAISNSFGFGGINTSIVLKKGNEGHGADKSRN
jgi:malonyl-ACP decarboxylase